MKLVLALFIALAGCAHSPALNTPGNGSASAQQGPDLAKLLESLGGGEPAPPKVDCIKVDAKCVAKYRLDGGIDEDSAGAAIRWIKAAEAMGADRIVIELNSPGGSVPDGFQLAKAIEDTNVPVTCVVDGEAASMAAYILESCPVRMITRRGTIMFHQPSVGGRFNGQEMEWRAIAEMLRAMSVAMAEHCSHRMNVTVDEYMKHTESGMMWWMTAEEAIHYGAVDQIVRSVSEAVLGG